jgi:hypothetical protein
MKACITVVTLGDEFERGAVVVLDVRDPEGRR